MVKYGETFYRRHTLLRLFLENQAKINEAFNSEYPYKDNHKILIINFEQMFDTIIQKNCS